MTKRNQELLALLIVFLLLAAGIFLVDLAKTLSLTPVRLAIIAIFVSFYLLAHVAMRIFLPQADNVILPLAAFLTQLGLIMIFRLKPHLLTVQLLWLGLGLLAMLALVIFLRDYGELENFKYVSVLLGLGLLLSPTFFGKEINGAKLWLNFGRFNFQPSEIAKVLIIIFLAAYLKDKKELLSISGRKLIGVEWPEFKHLGPLLTMWLLSLFILVFQKDLGSSFLFFAIFLVMIYVATGRGSFVGLGSALFLMGTIGSYFLFNHVRLRIDIWLNPWLDPANRSYQIVQSLFALAAGSFSGSGLGRGHPGYIPAVHTDFIFSALAEELGLLGAIAILLIYLLFAYRGFKIALNAEDEFGKLLALGLTSVFTLQGLVIIAGSSRLIPITGITLPFISYGGSSIVSNFILLGLLLGISRRASEENKIL